MFEDLTRPPIADAPLSLLLLPGANGANDVNAVDSWLSYLAKTGREFEVVLTARGPDDPLRSQLPSDSHLQIIDSLAEPGRALAAGLPMCRHPLLCIAPCDGQFQPSELSKLLDQINSVDLVAGCRVHGTVPPWLALTDLGRRLMTAILFGYLPDRRATWLGWQGWPHRWIARHVFGIRVHDPECAFRLYRRGVFDRIPIQSNSDFVHVEILAKANHLGCLMTEAAVSWQPPATTLGTLAPWRTEARRLFRHPEFGPAFAAESSHLAPRDDAGGQNAIDAPLSAHDADGATPPPA